MGVAYYPVLKRDPIEASNQVDGKMLAKVSDRLTTIAKQLKVKPLEDFLGAVPDLDDFESEDAAPEELWFPPAEGLVTVNALLGYLQTQSNAVSGQEGVIEDLVNLKDVLEFAQWHDTLWHLALDI